MLLHFWPLEKLAELADGPIECVEVARGGCAFAGHFSTTRSTSLTVEMTLDQTAFY